MKLYFCVRCMKETECVLVNKEEKDERMDTQCLVCGGVSGSIKFKADTVTFEGEWEKIEKTSNDKREPKS